MPLPASVAKKIADAKPTGGGNTIADGNYLFCVHKLLCEKKFKGTMFIAELGVVESEASFPGVEPNKAGTGASYCVNLDNNVSAPGNVKAFVLALMGKADGEVAPDAFVAELERLVSDAQPARGMLVGDETYRKTIQGGPNAGKPFTAHKWIHVPNLSADVAKRRAELDAAGR